MIVFELQKLNLNILLCEKPYIFDIKKFEHKRNYAHTTLTVKNIAASMFFYAWFSLYLQNELQKTHSAFY